jgi:ABC-type Fe3+/spermidine/putrescine transport system ATPase subunit
VYVTHDQEEALAVSDQIIVMDNAAIAQQGTPTELYREPASRFVADFIGLANIFEGEISGRAGGQLRIRCAPLGGEITAVATGTPASGPVAIMLRPEKMSLRKDAAGDAEGLPGTVRNVVYLGDESVYHVALRTGALVQVSRLNSDRGASGAIAREDAVRVGWTAASVVVMPP